MVEKSYRNAIQLNRNEREGENYCAHCSSPSRKTESNHRQQSQTIVVDHEVALRQPHAEPFAGPTHGPRDVAQADRAREPKLRSLGAVLVHHQLGRMDTKRWRVVGVGVALGVLVLVIQKITALQRENSIQGGPPYN